jgi:hypothetical protein
MSAASLAKKATALRDEYASLQAQFSDLQDLDLDLGFTAVTPEYVKMVDEKAKAMVDHHIKVLHQYNECRDAAEVS